MATITLAVPEELKTKMKSFPEINWSEVARQAIRQKLKDLEFLKSFKAESTITEKEAIELGRQLNKKIIKKYDRR